MSEAPYLCQFYDFDFKMDVFQKAKSRNWFMYFVICNNERVIIKIFELFFE